MNCSLLAALAIPFALACVPKREFSLAPVGPPPKRSSSSTATDGQLVVYSAWERTGTLDSEHQNHGSYAVLTADRKPVLQVRNWVSPMINDPAIVSLVPGSYFVKARVQGYGVILLPVVIESQKTTTLYLDDTTKPDLIGRDPAGRVRLPDGRVIGWTSSGSQ